MPFHYHDRKTKDETESKKEKRSFSPGAHGTVYLLGAAYLVYLLVTFLQSAYEGGEDAPSLPLLIAGILVLGGGTVFLLLMAWRMSHIPPETQQEEADAEKEPDDPNAVDGDGDRNALDEGIDETE
ncbi:MAG: hypothetical protein LUG84_00850 [Akkermansiaceae bacterium]|nr:hypothetical protein [Akkermansiaceae bacterium]